VTPILKNDTLKTLLKKDNNKPTIVVVGGGFAGINFVKSVCETNSQVILIDKHNYHQFQPLLYQVAISGLEPDSIVAPIRKLFNQTKNVHYVMGELLEINQEKNCINLDIGIIEYDYLVIATGSETNFYQNTQIEHNSFGLKNINDALNIRSWILQNLEKASLNPKKREYTHFVIAGGGPAGIEMAGSLADFRSKLLNKDYPDINKDFFQITLLEGSEQLLAAMSKKAQMQALTILKSMHIQVVLNSIVKDYDGETITYEARGQTCQIKAKTLIWTAGVKCKAIEGIDKESFTFQNRLAIDEYLKVKATKNIYAIGDIGYLESKEFPKGLPMVAQNAIQQGVYLSKNLLIKNPKKYFYHNKGSMAIIGKKDAVADIKSVFFKGRFGWLLWSFIHLVTITSFRNRLTVGFNWFVKYLSYEKANQLIIRKIDDNHENL
jgi:NADH dehydrogenase